MKLRNKQTKKLFYDKFVYKITVVTALAENFRGNDIPATSHYLQHVYEKMVEKGETERSWGSRWNVKIIKLHQVQRDITFSHLISSLDSYHVRVEGNHLSVYTNDLDFLENTKKLYDEPYALREMWLPENDKIKDFLLSNPKKIIRPEYSHKYKVTVNSIPDIESFKQWASKLPKLKVMSRNNYTIGGYFYVADEKTLSLCRIFLGDRIRRVDEILLENEIS